MDSNMTVVAKVNITLFEWNHLIGKCEDMLVACAEIVYWNDQTDEVDEVMESEETAHIIDSLAESRSWVARRVEWPEAERNPVWLHTQLNNTTFPTWRDVPTGDAALDDDEECLESQPEDPLTQEEIEPWLPDATLFRSEEPYLTTEEYDNDTDIENEISLIDGTEEINLNKLFEF